MPLRNAASHGAAPAIALRAREQAIQAAEALLNDDVIKTDRERAFAESLAEMVHTRLKVGADAAHSVSEKSEAESVLERRKQHMGALRSAVNGDSRLALHGVAQAQSDRDKVDKGLIRRADRSLKALLGKAKSGKQKEANEEDTHNVALFKLAFEACWAYAVAHPDGDDSLVGAVIQFLVAPCATRACVDETQWTTLVANDVFPASLPLTLRSLFLAESLCVFVPAMDDAFAYCLPFRCGEVARMLEPSLAALSDRTQHADVERDDKLISEQHADEGDFGSSAKSIDDAADVPGGAGFADAIADIAGSDNTASTDRVHDVTIVAEHILRIVATLLQKYSAAFALQWNAEKPAAGLVYLAKVVVDFLSLPHCPRELSVHSGSALCRILIAACQSSLGDDMQAAYLDATQSFVGFHFIAAQIICTFFGQVVHSASLMDVLCPSANGNFFTDVVLAFPDQSRLCLLRSLIVALSTGDLLCPLPEHLVDMEARGRSTNNLMLGIIFPAICELSRASYDRQFRASGLQALGECAQLLVRILQDNIQVLAEGDPAGSLSPATEAAFASLMLSDLLPFVWSNWGDRNDRVAEDCKALLRSVLDVHDSALALCLRDPERPLRLAIPHNFRENFTKRLLATSWSKKAKYGAIQEIMTRYGVHFLLQFSPDLFEELLVALCSQRPAAHAAGITIEKFLSGLHGRESSRRHKNQGRPGSSKTLRNKRDDGVAIAAEFELPTLNEDDTRLCQCWIPWLTKVICQPQVPDSAKGGVATWRSSIWNYALPAIWRILPESLPYILRALVAADADLLSRLQVLTTARKVGAVRGAALTSLSMDSSVIVSALRRHHEGRLPGISSLEGSYVDDCFVAALELVCFAFSPAEEPLTEFEVYCVRTAVGEGRRSNSWEEEDAQGSASLKIVRAGVRQEVVSNLSRFFTRLRHHVAIQRRTFRDVESPVWNSRDGAAEKLLRDIVGGLVRACYPGSPFSRKHVAIEVFTVLYDAFSGKSTFPGEEQIKSCLFPAEASLALLHNMWDPYDITREMVFRVLLRFPSPLPAMSTLDSGMWILKCGLQMLHSSRKRDCEGGTMLVTVFVEKFVKPLRRFPSLVFPASGNGAEVTSALRKLLDGTTQASTPSVLAAIMPQFVASNVEYADADSAVLAFVLVLLDMVDYHLQIARVDLACAALGAPMHGPLQCVRSLLQLVDLDLSAASGHDWSRVVTRLYRLSEGIIDVTAPVVCDLTPEGYQLPGADTNIDTSTSEVGHAIANSSINQAVTVCSWLCVRDVCVGAGVLMRAVSLPGVVLGVSQVREFGQLLLRVMLTTRHVGAIETAFPGFQDLCGRMLESPDVVMLGLLKQWLDRLLGIVAGDDTFSKEEHGRKDLTITRRSAGLPYAFRAILRAEGATHRVRRVAVLVPHAMDRLLKLASPAQSDAQVRIHASNVMRSFFADRSLCPELYLPAAMNLVLSGFRSESWGVRNAAMMLFSTLMHKIAPGRWGGGSLKDQRLRSNTSFADFFGKYPDLRRNLYSHLKELVADIGQPSQQVAVRDDSSLYAMLLLLGALDSGADNATENCFTGEFIPLVIQCNAHSNWMVRVAAAVALEALTSSQQVPQIVAGLLRLGDREQPMSANAVHGSLLQVANLIEAHSRKMTAGDLSLVIKLVVGSESDLVRVLLAHCPAFTPSALRIVSFACEADSVTCADLRSEVLTTVRALPMMGDMNATIARCSFISCAAPDLGQYLLSLIATSCPPPVRAWALQELRRKVEPRLEAQSLLLNILLAETSGGDTVLTLEKIIKRALALWFAWKLPVHEPFVSRSQQKRLWVRLCSLLDHSPARYDALRLMGLVLGSLLTSDPGAADAASMVDTFTFEINRFAASDHVGDIREGSLAASVAVLDAFHRGGVSLQSCVVADCATSAWLVVIDFLTDEHENFRSIATNATLRLLSERHGSFVTGEIADDERTFYRFMENLKSPLAHVFLHLIEIAPYACNSSAERLLEFFSRPFVDLVQSHFIPSRVFGVEHEDTLPFDKDIDNTYRESLEITQFCALFLVLFVRRLSHTKQLAERCSALLSRLSVLPRQLTKAVENLSALCSVDADNGTVEKDWSWSYLRSFQPLVFDQVSTLLCGVWILLALGKQCDVPVGFALRDAAHKMEHQLHPVLRAAFIALGDDKNVEHLFWLTQ